MPWKRALIIWVAIALTEIVHGTLRTIFLAPLVGDWRSRQLGVGTGSMLILAIVCLTIRWLGAGTRGALIRVGLLWLALMLTFEFAAGRFIAGYSWSRILSDYDLPHGGLLSLGMLMLLASPYLAARIRGVLPAG